MLFLWLHTMMTSGNADAYWSILLLCPQTGYPRELACPIWPACGVDLFNQKQVKCQWKYNNIEYNSDKRSCLWIGPCHCFPKPSSPNGLPHLAVYRRSGLQWLEKSPIQCQLNTQWQWFIFDQIQFRHAGMLVYWSLLLFPQIDCPRWLPHLADSWRSEPQLSVTSLWRDHGYNANANLSELTSVATH